MDNCYSNKPNEQLVTDLSSILRSAAAGEFPVAGLYIRILGLYERAYEQAGDGLLPFLSPSLDEAFRALELLHDDGVVRYYRRYPHLLNALADSLKP